MPPESMESARLQGMVAKERAFFETRVRMQRVQDNGACQDADSWRAALALPSRAGVS